ncbi:MAG: hypothetical protein JO100_15840 [Pseudonocardia sp.]|nr:hypothetical protein [Pseudonocardia sp.]
MACDEFDRGRHILFLPYPSHGHLRPTLGIARELIRRGHRVTYALNGAISEVARATGARVVAYETALMSNIKPPDSWTEDALGAGFLQYITEITGTTSGIERQVARDRPDLIAYDCTIWAPGRVLGHKWGLPTIQLLPIFASNDAYSYQQAQIDNGGHPTLPEDHPVVTTVRELIATFLSEHGIDAAQGEALMAGKDEHGIVFLPRSLQPCGETFGDDHVFVGPCSEEGPADESWRAAEGDSRPMVFISLGTVVNDHPEFFRLCAEAFAGRPWRVALAVGDALDEREMTSFPDNFTVRRWVPYGAILPYASVFVSHAGMGGIMEAGRSATPLVLIPFQPDQRIIADRITELGLGRQLARTEVTPQSLRAVVEDVAADTGAAAGMAKLRADIQAAGGAVRAADVIEGRLALLPRQDERGDERIGVAS